MIQIIQEYKRNGFQFPYRLDTLGLQFKGPNGM